MWWSVLLPGNIEENDEGKDDANKGHAEEVEEEDRLRLRDPRDEASRVGAQLVGVHQEQEPDDANGSAVAEWHVDLDPARDDAGRQRLEVGVRLADDPRGRGRVEVDHRQPDEQVHVGVLPDAGQVGDHVQEDGRDPGHAAVHPDHMEHVPHVLVGHGDDAEGN